MAKKYYFCTPKVVPSGFCPYGLIGNQVRILNSPAAVSSIMSG